ncbi:hypothetical protein D3C80_1394360 [compost metagenome]
MPFIAAPVNLYVDSLSLSYIIKPNGLRYIRRSGNAYTKESRNQIKKETQPHFAADGAGDNGVSIDNYDSAHWFIPI